MSIEDDIARSLPTPPRPAPGKRTAAIDLALRRFDGVEAEAPGGQRGRIWSTSPWANGGRRYAGALATFALIALIGVPAAWNGLYPPAAAPEDTPATRDIAQEPVSGAAPDAAAAPEPQVTENASDRQAPAPSRSPVGPVPQAERATGAEERVVPESASPAALAEAAPPPPLRTDAPAEVTGQVARSRPEPPQQFSAADVVVTGSRIAAAPAPALRTRNENEESSIVVTGGRARRGDWNACTVDDPGRSLAACRARLDAAGKGRSGVAAAHISDGLSRAWNGDLAAAITAFDRAVAIAPKSEAALLNRGLARRRSGDLDRALTDLDQAVRYAPQSARAYYNRSLVYQEIGATARAKQDVKKAIALDPRYADIAE